MNYLMIILIPTMLYVFEEILPTRLKLFRKIGIAFIIIMTSLRYNFGADYNTYFEAFYRIKNGIFIDEFEPGYFFLNKIIAIAGLHFNFVLLIIAIFNYVLLYLSIEQNLNKNKWLAIFLYLIYFDLFFYSLSALRQSIVMAIFLYSMRYIRSKKPIKYIIWLLLGSLFHLSAIILIPFYFIYHKISNYGFWKISLIMIEGILIFCFIVQYLDLIRPFMNNKMDYYLFIHDAGIDTNLFGAVTMIVLMLVLVYSIKKMNAKVLIKSKKVIGNTYIRQLSISVVSIIIFFVLKAMQMIYYYSIIPRLQMYFYVFYIFAIPELIELAKQKFRIIAILLIIIFMIVFFVYSYLEINQYASIYYEKFRLLFE